MADIIDIEEYRSHTFFEAMCVECHHRWFAVVRSNVLLKKLECPLCHITGRSINTGQIMKDSEGCFD